ncbi:hypothetical protein ABZX93_27245 [Streptomyces sp. NPDC006632]|uniref:hypothetical protein n=1 Tax=Streptomyces sp. NPDC006632 TaxID=3157182 RepID=UPI0033BBAD30
MTPAGGARHEVPFDILTTTVKIADVQNPGSPASRDRPDGCVVLAGQAVQPAAGKAGDSELGTDAHQLGDAAGCLAPQLQPDGLAGLAVDAAVVDRRSDGCPEASGAGEGGWASTAVWVSSRITSQEIRPERRAMPTYSHIRL